MRANSLALRLFVTATLWTVVILAGTAILLSSLYRQAVERSFDHRLSVYLRSLVADVASPDIPPDKFPQSLGEPLFELPMSGWYWQVTRLDGKKDLRVSRSLSDQQLKPLPRRDSADSETETREGYVQGPEDQQLRLIERTVDLGNDGRFLIAVAGDASEIEAETEAFYQALAITFGALAIVLILTTVFQVRFGLAPLKRISESLTAIRSGAAERLEGNFPDEIAPLARETNALIDANKQIVERARTHVGNLAHALKTPLSVMVNEAVSRGEDSFAQ
jgi:signal transduction histidine kinase